jgi:hypothetical protein
MLHGAVDLVNELGETSIEIRERPHGELPGIDGTRDLPDIAGDLSVSLEIMNKVHVRTAEQPFTIGPETSFGRRPSLLRALVAG